jgi:hypothetical protein
LDQETGCLFRQKVADADTPFIILTNLSSFGADASCPESLKPTWFARRMKRVYANALVWRRWKTLLTCSSAVGPRDKASRESVSLSRVDNAVSDTLLRGGWIKGNKNNVGEVIALERDVPAVR